MKKFMNIEKSLSATFLMSVFAMSLFFTSIVSADELAGQLIDETINVDSNSFIEIKHVNGSASITSWNENKVHVKGRLGERAEDFIFERDGNSVTIEVKVKKSNSWNWGKDNEGDRLEIYVPTKSRIEYHSTNAAVKVSGIDGDSDIQVINGSIRVEDLSGQINLGSVNGDIRATGLKGELKVNTVNGEIKAQQVSGDEVQAVSVNGEIELTTNAKQIHVETVNGRMTVVAGEVIDVQATTVNGRMRFDMNLGENGKLRASSVSGRLSLGFQENLFAKFNVQAHAGGSIKNDLTNDKVTKAKYGPRRSLAFSIGNPTAHAEISTVSGSIELRTRD